MQWNSDKVNSLKDLTFSEDYKYFKAEVDGQLAGFYCLQSIQEKTYICHVGIYKKFRGFTAFCIGKAFLEFISRTMEYITLLCFIPVTKKNVINYALRADFKPIGLLENSIKIDNQFVDQLILQYNG